MLSRIPLSRTGLGSLLAAPRIMSRMGFSSAATERIFITARCAEVPRTCANMPHACCCMGQSLTSHRLPCDMCSAYESSTSLQIPQPRRGWRSCCASRWSPVDARASSTSSISSLPTPSRRRTREPPPMLHAHRTHPTTPTHRTRPYPPALTRTYPLAPNCTHPPPPTHLPLAPPNTPSQHALPTRLPAAACLRRRVLRSRWTSRRWRYLQGALSTSR